MAGRDSALLTVSVAAELAGMHAQTLRQYDRLGIVVARRTKGGGRRYSLADVEKLQEVQRMSQEEGINLAGISQILELREEIRKLEEKLTRAHNRAARLQAELDARKARERRVFATGSDGSTIQAPSPEQLRAYLRAMATEAQLRTLAQIEAAGPNQSTKALVPYVMQ
ncbi:MerR family transcriptional regulator, heat shock protein HspR [Actinobaculum suis]|uniref:Glutamine synthetase repressor n=1 Tax=Actinobaculum suis TaxID=1657 RepID=A0A0K9ERT7_9ACTO|nr:MerR family transcriptional regulator [Actinobaculum suis]KMY22919.1 heat shock regulator protein HspR [Actinobaculum suis]MDY5152516.1 MerR family transcriptional regulator [Actinobaculum suis]OCA94748.1 heat-shock protein HspR [Actinobaculum suis]OCA95522.1 heat-shock protein HspR [Actinobaculum suis]SDE40459.1 MerR family transcriptional regulator, heat shock protein HspR [Actinobaculum suis]